MENETIITEEVYKKFLRKQTKASMIVIRICYGLLLACAGLSLFFNLTALPGEETNWAYLVYCLVMAILFILFDIFLVPINLKLSKTRNLIGSTYKYYFDESTFSVSVLKDDKIVTESKNNYSLIYKVVFFENYIYIFINRANAFIVCKEGFKSEQDYVNIVNALKPFENNKLRQKNF